MLHKNTISVTLVYHGSHIFGLTNFHDFSSIFFPFSSIFSVFYLMNLKYTEIYLTSTFQLKREKVKTGQIFLIFPVFWVKLPVFSGLFKVPWLEKVFLFFQSMWKPCLACYLSKWSHVSVVNEVNNNC